MSQGLQTPEQTPNLCGSKLGCSGHDVFAPYLSSTGLTSPHYPKVPEGVHNIHVSLPGNAAQCHSEVMQVH